MAYIIAIANEKGGVAKTTTCISIGGALVEYGYEVLIVDLDAQANLTMAVGMKPINIRWSSADMLLNSENAINICLQTNIPGLTLIPANSDMGLAERFLTIRRNYTQILKRALVTVQKYDYILLDCPPSLGAVTLNALISANFLLIPTQAEYFSSHALRNMLNTVSRIKSQENYDLDYKILITMFDKRNRIHRSIREQLYLHFDEQVFQGMVQIDTKLRESAVVGIPICLYDHNTRSSIQYRALTQELMQYVEKRSVAQPA